MQIASTSFLHDQNGERLRGTCILSVSTSWGLRSKPAYGHTHIKQPTSIENIVSPWLLYQLGNSGELLLTAAWGSS